MCLLLEVVNYINFISLFNIITYIQFTLIKVPFALFDCFINYPKLVRVYNL